MLAKKSIDADHTEWRPWNIIRGLFCFSSGSRQPGSPLNNEGMLMRNVLLLILLLVLPGCATTVAESGRRIQVVPSQKSEQLKRCERLGQVTGESQSFLNNGEYGVIYATNDARNKAALIPRADTVEIISDGPRVIGGTVTGIVYNCSAPSGVSTVSPAVAAHTADLPSTLAITPAPASAAGISTAVFEKARKCQDRSGVWVNDTCVLQIE